MLEIRVCWPPDIEHEERGVFRDGGFWYRDVPEVRRALVSIVDELNRTHGAGTHWLEERPDDGEPIPVYH